VIAINGAVLIAQVEVTAVVTATPQTLTPVAVEMLVAEQFAGAT